MKKLILAFICLFSVVPYQAEATCDPNIPGDVSGDCKVDFNDFAMISSDWLKAGEPHEWVARYNSPGNQHDVAGGIAIDSSDNIYVTGYSYGSSTSSDYATIKYSPDSNQPVWVARYNGPDNSTDYALAIAVDSNDNIYVTGVSYGSGTSSDYATIKYSPDSNQPVWVARYNGPDNTGDSAVAIAVDSSDNIYVTGESEGSGTSSDYATIKYSPDSNQPVWVARYNGPDNDSDSAYAIAVDSNDNIYVTGISEGSGTYYDYATIKYSPDSNQPVWVARYDGPGTGTDNDYASAIAVDSNDNIYVTGISEGSGTYYDYATIKYSPDSNQPVWIARYDGPASREDAAVAIAVDSNDNIYVTGDSFGSGTEDDYTTIKYSPDSNQPVWIARYDGPAGGVDWPCAIVVDGNNNIYVTGFSYASGPGFDYATIKYSPDSNQPVWVARYHAKASGYGSHNDIDVDSNDNIYVTGDSLGSVTNDDYATLKYSPDYTCKPQVTGDLNHDCEVDLYDLQIFCQHWLLGVE